MQFDEILTALQAPAAQQARAPARGLRNRAHPSADRGRGRDPGSRRCRAERGATRSTRRSTTAAGRAARLAGRRGVPRDRARRPLPAISGSARTFGARLRPRGAAPGAGLELQPLHRGARRPVENLGRTIEVLAPTLETTRTLARQPQPDAAGAARLGDRVPPGARRAAGDDRRPRPWLDQAKPLLSKPEPGGLVSWSAGHPRPRRRQPGGLTTLPQVYQLSRCTSDVLIPTGNQVIDDRFTTGQPNYREFFYTTVNLAGESQNFDGNGPYLRLQPGNGDLTASQTDPNGNLATDKTLWATRRSRRSAPARLRAEAALPPRRQVLHQRRPRPQRGLGAVGPPSPAQTSYRRQARSRRSRERSRDKRRAHWRADPEAADPRSRGDFLAVCVLVIAALAVTLGILSQQKAALPSWVPFFGQEFFHLEAEFTSAQAVTPGQGQAMVVAGIQVGKIDSVSVEDGHAVVGMDIDPKYAPLIHPRRAAAAAAEDQPQRHGGRGGPGPARRAAARRGDDPARAHAGRTSTRTSSSPPWTPTRAQYLTLLLQGGAEGIGGRAKGKQLSAGLRRLEPFARYTAQLTGALAKRRGGARARRPRLRPAHRRARPPRRSRSRVSSTLERCARWLRRPAGRRFARRCASCRRPSTRRAAASRAPTSSPTSCARR